jgi:hypothetical protein
LCSASREGKVLRRKITILSYSKFLIDYGMRLRIFYQKEKPLKTVGGRTIIPYRKVIDGILYVLRTERMSMVDAT